MTKLFTAQLFAVSCPRCSLPRRHTSDGTRGKRRAPISHANARATRQPISGDALGRTCRISQQQDLTLEELLKRLPIPNRPDALIPPPPPPYFQTIDRERRARMIEECARPGSELQRRIQQGWIPLFTPPPPPSYIPKEVFMAQIMKAIEQRFQDVASAAQKLRARGGKIVFVRLPFSRRTQSSRGSHDTAQSDLGSINERHGRSRNLFRRFSRASGLQLPRVVALVRR